MSRELSAMILRKAVEMFTVLCLLVPLTNAQLWPTSWYQNKENRDECFVPLNFDQKLNGVPIVTDVEKMCHVEHNIDNNMYIPGQVYHINLTVFGSDDDVSVLFGAKGDGEFQLNTEYTHGTCPFKIRGFVEGFWFFAPAPGKNNMTTTIVWRAPSSDTGGIPFGWSCSSIDNNHTVFVNQILLAEDTRSTTTVTSTQPAFTGSEGPETCADFDDIKMVDEGKPCPDGYYSPNDEISCYNAAYNLGIYNELNQKSDGFADEEFEVGSRGCYAVSMEYPNYRIVYSPPGFSSCGSTLHHGICVKCKRGCDCEGIYCKSADCNTESATQFLTDFRLACPADCDEDESTPSIPSCKPFQPTWGQQCFETDTCSVFFKNRVNYDNLFLIFKDTISCKENVFSNVVRNVNSVGLSCNLDQYLGDETFLDLECISNFNEAARALILACSQDCTRVDKLGGLPQCAPGQMEWGHNCYQQPSCIAFLREDVSDKLKQQFQYCTNGAGAGDYETLVSTAAYQCGIDSIQTVSLQQQEQCNIAAYNFKKDLQAACPKDCEDMSDGKNVVNGDLRACTQGEPEWGTKCFRSPNCVAYYTNVTNEAMVQRLTDVGLLNCPQYEDLLLDIYAAQRQCGGPSPLSRDTAAWCDVGKQRSLSAMQDACYSGDQEPLACYEPACQLFFDQMDENKLLAIESDVDNCDAFAAKSIRYTLEERANICANAGLSYKFLAARGDCFSHAAKQCNINCFSCMIVGPAVKSNCTRCASCAPYSHCARESKLPCEPRVTYSFGSYNSEIDKWECPEKQGQFVTKPKECNLAAKLYSSIHKDNNILSSPFSTNPDDADAEGVCIAKGKQFLVHWESTAAFPAVPVCVSLGCYNNVQTWGDYTIIRDESTNCPVNSRTVNMGECRAASTAYGYKSLNQSLGGVHEINTPAALSACSVGGGENDFTFYYNSDEHALKKNYGGLTAVCKRESFVNILHPMAPKPVTPNLPAECKGQQAWREIEDQDIDIVAALHCAKFQTAEAKNWTMGPASPVIQDPQYADIVYYMGDSFCGEDADAYASYSVPLATCTSVPYGGYVNVFYQKTNGDETVKIFSFVDEDCKISYASELYNLGICDPQEGTENSFFITVNDIPASTQLNSSCGTNRSSELSTYFIGETATAKCECGNIVYGFEDCQLAYKSFMELNNQSAMQGVVAQAWMAGPPGCHVKDGVQFQYNTYDSKLVAPKGVYGYSPVCQIPDTPQTELDCQRAKTTLGQFKNLLDRRCPVDCNTQEDDGVPDCTVGQQERKFKCNTPTCKHYFSSEMTEVSVASTLRALEKCNETASDAVFLRRDLYQVAYACGQQIDFEVPSEVVCDTLFNQLEARDTFCPKDCSNEETEGLEKCKDGQPEWKTKCDIPNCKLYLEDLYSTLPITQVGNSTVDASEMRIINMLNILKQCPKYKDQLETYSDDSFQSIATACGASDAIPKTEPAGFTTTGPVVKDNTATVLIVAFLTTAILAIFAVIVFVVGKTKPSTPLRFTDEENGGEDDDDDEPLLDDIHNDAEITDDDGHEQPPQNRIYEDFGGIQMTDPMSLGLQPDGQ
eukprot:m.111661 g.111661  ORF g.111661 m.111661 type:complete len:1575 (-) comp14066_c0_seq2:114-4838(-)